MSSAAGSFPTQLLSKLEKISIGAVSVGDLVGKGRFKRVHKGRWRGRDVVLLRYSKDTQRGFSPPKQRGVDWVSEPPQAAEELDKNLNELKILSSISKKENSQYVPEIFGVCHEPKSTIIVQEFAPWGMLKSNLKDPAFTTIVTNLHKLHCAVQICRAMAFLESERIVHADLSCRNVLVFRCEEAPNSMVAKVSDFGLSIVLKEGVESEVRRQPMPTRWCSPETVAMYKLSHKADVWSYGVTHWEIYADGQDPWPLRSKRSDVAARLRDLAENLAQAAGGDDVSADFPKAEDCPDVVHRTYLSCFKAEEAARPSFTQLADALDRIIEAGGDMDSHPSPFPASTPAVQQKIELPRRQSVEPDSVQWKWWREKAKDDTEIAKRLKVLKKFASSEREMLLEAEGRLLQQQEQIEEMKKEASKRSASGSVNAGSLHGSVTAGSVRAPLSSGGPRSVDVMYPKYGEFMDPSRSCPTTPPVSNFWADGRCMSPYTPLHNGCATPGAMSPIPIPHVESGRSIGASGASLTAFPARACFTLWSVAGGLLYQQEFATEAEAMATFHYKRNAGQPCSLRNMDGEELASSSWQALDSYWKEAWKLFPGTNFFQGVRLSNLSPPRCVQGSGRVSRHTIGGASWTGSTGSSTPGVRNVVNGSGSSVNVNGSGSSVNVNAANLHVLSH